MQADEKLYDAIADKVKEQSEALTLWARETLGLPIGDRVKITITIERTTAIDVDVDRRDWLYDQEPTPEEWETVLKYVHGLANSTRNRSWEQVTKALRDLRKSGNTGYVRDAGRLNAYFRTHGYPFKVVRLNNHGSETRHSLFVARRSTPGTSP